jgi:hypothetical protein
VPAIVDAPPAALVRGEENRGGTTASMAGPVPAGLARLRERPERSGVRFPILDDDAERPASNGGSCKRQVGSPSRCPDPTCELRRKAFTLLDRSSTIVAVVSGPCRPVPLTKRAAAVTIWSGNALRTLNQHPPTAARKL